MTAADLNSDEWNRYRKLSDRARLLLSNRINLPRGYGQYRIEDPEAERELERAGYLPLTKEESRPSTT
jgi:hypothetical protein